jgi:membrane protein DedA with SNARE-associated domain
VIEVQLLHYGYLFVFVGAILEGDATLLTASFLARRGYLLFQPVILVAGTATIAANQVYFEFARRQGPRILNAYPAAQPRVAKISAWVPRFGGPVVLASRFMFGLRTLVPMVCGASGMSQWRFAAWNVAGAILWAGTFGAAGYLGAHALTIALSDIRRHEVTLAAGIAVIAVALTAWVTRGRDWSDFWCFAQSVFKDRRPR